MMALNCAILQDAGEFSTRDGWYMGERLGGLGQGRLTSVGSHHWCDGLTPSAEARSRQGMALINWKHEFKALWLGCLLCCH